MATRTRYRVNLMNSERCKLEELIRKQTLPQRVAKRARIILMANGDGATNQEIAAIEIATGTVQAHCGNARTEEDFSQFIETLIQQHPAYRV